MSESSLSGRAAAKRARRTPTVSGKKRAPEAASRRPEAPSPKAETTSRPADARRGGRPIEGRPAEGRRAEGRRAEGRRAETRGEASPPRRGGDKRDRILEAAVRVFARQGFYATRVSEVAKAAGVADGTIYLYFKSKDELLVSLFEDRITRLLAHLREELPKLASPAARLERIIELQLGLLEGEKDLAEVVTIIIRQSTKLMKEFAAPKFLTYLDTIAEVVAEGQAAGVFRADVSPHLVARAVFGALDGIALTWALGKAQRGGLVKSAGQLAQIILRGLAPNGSP